MTSNQPREIDVLFMQAAADGQTDTARRWLLLGANVDVRNAHGMTSLHWAALNGHADTVEMLLEHGANKMICDKRGAMDIISPGNPPVWMW